ncbi:hypothetical protein [Streptomyces sp. SCSIO ZS0520]|uniref:hypothetical protein n=1 Tax=Streptomyces sp. SCSIO ZS0520 TaxID=2892996 RepID=UPI0021D89C8E|nr:hypothetical protein [Streptomyces sp. SCSIO ZS0520]
MNAPPPHPPPGPRLPRQPQGPEGWPDQWPPQPPLRPAKAWYLLVALLMMCGAGFTGLGVVAGLFLKAGKWAACDITADCAHHPNDPGYREPGYPLWPFVTAAVLAALALGLFLVLFLARRRNARAQGGPSSRTD